MRMTKFGAVEVSENRIYNKPINSKVIVRVDLLECLRETFGNECFICRELLYTILCGEHAIYDVNSVFASFYRKYPKVTEYVNDIYHYGNNSIPILERAILPLRERVNNYRDEMMKILSSSGGKYLLHTHDFLYFAYTPNAKIPDVQGVKIIC